MDAEIEKMLQEAKEFQEAKLYGPWPPRCRSDKCFCGPHRRGDESDIERKMRRQVFFACKPSPIAQSCTPEELAEWRALRDYLDSNEARVAMDLNRYEYLCLPGMHERT